MMFPDIYEHKGINIGPIEQYNDKLLQPVPSFLKPIG